MHRALEILCLTVAYFAPPNLYSREWKDSSGKHSIEADFVEGEIVLQLPTGEMKTIKFDKLSQGDREYIADVLRRPASAKAETANGKNGGEVAVEVKHNAAPNKPQISINADTLLLAEQNEWLNLSRSVLHSYADYFAAFNYQFADAAVQFQRYKQTVKDLSELAPKEKRVADVFSNRLAQLTNAPDPKERVDAALRLTGAVKISDQILPTLIHALEKDASPEVQLAAAISLAGYGPIAKDAIPLLVKLEARDETLHPSVYLEREPIYLFAIIEIGGNSPQLRKIVKKTFDSYRRSNERIAAKACSHTAKALVLLGKNANWAVTPLLQTAELSIKRPSDQDLFKNITDALVSIASNDARVLKYYETQAKDGPVEQRVYCDSIAKQLKLRIKP